MMRYVGVPNSRTKDHMVRREPIETIAVDPQDLAWDCTRHIAFLRECGIGRQDVRDTDYARYLRESGRSESAAYEKCLAFLRHFVHVRDGSVPQIWAIVTRHGFRLDGSHRAAIAVVLDKGRVPVHVVPTYPFDGGWAKRMTAIRDEKLRGQK